MPRKTKTIVGAAPIQETTVEEETNTPVPAPAPKAVYTNSQIFDQAGELVVDVYETNANFVVVSAIAGVQIKDLDISLEKDMMVIKGSRLDPHDASDKKYFYQECHWGPFSRKVVLPENINIDQADAQIDKGILTIKIPKDESGSGKIGIKVN